MSSSDSLKGGLEEIMDTISPELRSQIMSRIRSKDTKPEMLVRKLAFSLGYRYRLHAKDLPGCPDMVFRSRRKVIFIHGCFWHLHRDCAQARLPKSRLDFWGPKLEGNRARDRKNQRKLTRSGWRTLTVWECEVHDGGLGGRIRKFLDDGTGNDSRTRHAER